jgi:positive regulator of sigma E activity
MLNEKKEFYYINMGVLIYLFGSTILFLVGNLTIVLSPRMNKITWILNSILYIVYQIFILVEWKKSFSKKREFNTIL